MTNDFTIPAKSAIVENNRMIFRKHAVQYKKNRSIVLPGSNKHPEPQMMKVKK